MSKVKKNFSIYSDNIFKNYLCEKIIKGEQKMYYGARLKFLRERLGKSLTDMGKILEISDSLYSRYEKEIQMLPTKHLIFLANYFDVSIDYLFGFTNLSKYPNFKDTNTIESGKRLKEFRKEQKITQDKLSQSLNIAIGLLCEYEHGKYPISIHALYTISLKYKISADYLLGRIDDPK